MFTEKLSGKKVTLSLDYILPADQQNSSTSSARSFHNLLRSNADRLSLLKDFSHIKGIEKVKETMIAWKKSAHRETEAVYYIYPNNTTDCVGCLGIKKQGDLAEISYWLDKNATGNGYMPDALRTIEKDLFKNNTSEIIIRYYQDNPHGTAVHKNAQICGYTECSFKGIGTRDGQEKVFNTFHKTKEMFDKEQKKQAIFFARSKKTSTI